MSVPNQRTESQLTASVVRCLTRLRDCGSPVWWFKIHGGGWSQAGVPDLLIVVAGRAVFVELKAGKNKPSKLQAARIQQIRAARAVVVVARSVAEVMELVRSILQEEHAREG